MAGPTVVLFDLDGVVLTQKALEYTALIHLRKKFYNWQNIDNLRLIDFARIFEEADSKNRFKALKKVNLAYKPFIPNRIKRLFFFVRFRCSYKKYEKMYEEINPQLKSILIKLKKKRIISGIVSNTSGKRLTYYKLKFNLEEYISVFISRDNIPVRKPHPYSIIFALKKIKEQFNIPRINKKKVYYIGDLSSDIKCAKAANVNSIALLSGHGTDKQLKKSKADYILKELKDIMEIEPFKKLLSE
jgi:phosphoglycolate phosphatase-like HAD superfamily hydrolase